MDRFKLPSPLVLTGNLGENWRRWEQRFQIYMTASGADGKDRKIKVAILLHALGEEALEVYNTLDIAHGEDEGEEEDEQTVNDILAAFRAYCLPKKNTVFERHQFWAHPMSGNTTIEKYVTELKQKSKDCEFYTTENDMIRDKIVFSMNDQRLKERLLREPNLTLERAIDTCRAAETAKVQMLAMNAAAQEMSVLAVHKNSRQGQKTRTPPIQRTQDMGQRHETCKQCGKSHQPRQCPAYGVSCHNCGKQNHYAKMCRSAKAQHHKTVHDVAPEIDTLYIGTVNIDQLKSKADKSWHSNVNVDCMCVKFKLDTGAEANVLPLKVFTAMTRKARRERRTHLKLQPTKTVLVAYGGMRLKPEGVVTLKCSTPKTQASLTFYVSRHSSIPILGNEACEELRLVKRVDIDSIEVKHPTTKEELIAQHPTVFEGLGEFAGEYHIHTDPKATPVIHGCRKIPLAVMDRLRDTLDDLLQADVIVQVTEPTPWVNSLVITEKKDRKKLRVCLAPSDLNKAILRQHYSIPTTDEVLCKLAGKKLFTVLDEKDGYWQIKLDKESSLLCTFNTPWGRYRFKRLPFGIKSASEVFQQRNCETFGDIQGIHIIADDMIIAASSEKEHDEILQKVIARANEANVKFNKDKIQYKVSSVNYMGHTVTSEGVKADNAKIKAITGMPTPTDKTGLQRLLGMVKYLAQYIPGEATISAPLRQLLRKDSVWLWQHEHDEAVKKLKDALITAPVLSYFDPKKQLIIQADASKDGLGACLMHEGHPIAYASRALTQTEKNYAQIEKELLAIVFSVKRFHQYVYGLKVDVQSDHKPLESILRKPLGAAPSRLQRMLLQLQRYDLNVIYTPGKDLLIADTLSRAVTHDEHSTVDDITDEKVVYALEPTDALSTEMLQKLKSGTANDEILQLLQETHRQGWPRHRKQVHTKLVQYWPIRHTLSVIDEIMFAGDRIILPSPMRSDMLQTLHVAHQGMQRTKALARRHWYWPGMSREIEQMVENCGTCQQFQPRNQREPLISHDIPELPWLKIGADIFEIKGQSFLLMVDYLSKYPEVLNINDKTSHTVIKKMKSVFSRIGIPKEIVCDHVPFASQEMRNFAESWGIKLTHSSPGYAQSNGLAERTVQTVKHVLKKAQLTNTDPHLALLILRNTPVTGMQYSPAQMLMGRVLRSTLPSSTVVLQPAVPKDVHSTLENLQRRQQQYYDRGTRPLPELQPGSTVHMETEQGWRPALVTAQRDEPRSYDVVTSSGQHYRRNRRNLRKTPHNAQMDPEPDLPEDNQLCTPDADTSETVECEMSSPQSTRRTRCGRLIRPPERYKDFLIGSG